jgi:hypothetical protein
LRQKTFGTFFSGYNPGVKTLKNVPKVLSTGFSRFRQPSGRFQLETFFSWKKLTKALCSASLGLLLLSNTACVPGVDAAPPQPATVTPEILPTATIVWFPPTATHTPFPTFQPSATTEPFPGMGASLYTDDFSDPFDWTNARTESQGSNNVLLSGNRLTLSANAAPVTLTSLRSGLILTDFYAQTSVNLNRCEGRDAYGMFFRTATEAYTYRYTLTCDGQMRVERVRGGETYPLSDWETSGDLPRGAPGQVKLGVWVAGTEMRFFLNDRYQFTVIDQVFRSGSVGYFASVRSEVGLNVSFSDLRINAVSYVSPTPTATPSRTPLPSRTPRPTP